MIQCHGIARLKKYIIMGCYGSKLHILNIPLCVWLTKTKKDKNKVLQTANECYIFKKHGAQGYRIWYFLKKNTKTVLLLRCESPEYGFSICFGVIYGERCGSSTTQTNMVRSRTWHSYNLNESFCSLCCWVSFADLCLPFVDACDAKNHEATSSSGKTAICLTERSARWFGERFYEVGSSGDQQGTGDFLEPSCQGPFHLDRAQGDQGQVHQEHQQLLPTQPGLSGDDTVNVFWTSFFAGDTLAGKERHHKSTLQPSWNQGCENFDQFLG